MTKKEPKERRIIPVTFTESDLALLNELEELAHQDGRVISDVIRRALRFWAASEDAALMKKSAQSALKPMTMMKEMLVKKNEGGR